MTGARRTSVLPMLASNEASLSPPDEPELGISSPCHKNRTGWTDSSTITSTNKHGDLLNPIVPPVRTTKRTPSSNHMSPPKLQRRLTVKKRRRHSSIARANEEMRDHMALLDRSAANEVIFAVQQLASESTVRQVTKRLCLSGLGTLLLSVISTEPVMSCM